MYMPRELSVPQPCCSPEVQKARETRARGCFRVVGIGASAGGFHSLCATLRPLPPTFPCPILVVQHLSPLHKSVLADLLARQTELKVTKARDSELAKAGCVYVGPPDMHLVVGSKRIRLLRTPELHHHRPSIDLLFESIAAAYGSQALAVVLSGSGNDGSRGIIAVHEAGGLVLCEDPAEAEFKSMPQSAVSTGYVDIIAGLGKIAGVIAELCSD